MTDQVFSGQWLFRHWYPSKDDSQEVCGEYKMTAHQKGDNIIFEIDPSENHSSYLLVRLRLDDQVASGTWHEKAKHDGPFEGEEYSGAGQLIFDADKKEFKGLWVGAGMDRAANKPKIYTGRWEIIKQ
jgi:hypothetical protein